jgi:hypothetical protein
MVSGALVEWYRNYISGSERITFLINTYLINQLFHVLIRFLAVRWTRCHVVSSALCVQSHLSFSSTPVAVNHAIASMLHKASMLSVSFGDAAYIGFRLSSCAVNQCEVLP